MNKIRQSQLISPWGIGQIVNFPNDVSLMVCGLDAWEKTYQYAEDPEEFKIREERLEKQLGVSHFRLPPDYRERKKDVRNSNLSIPFVNFPLWQYCPRCGWMTKRSPFGYEKSFCIGNKYSEGLSCDQLKRRPRLIPVRFITVCRKGHIEDFPFEEWVHRGEKCKKGRSQLRLIAGKSSTLSGIEISCICGAKRSMAGSFSEGALDNLKKCSGNRPWLGEVDGKGKGCGESLTVVQRGASNVYFPIVKSAIFLPGYGEFDTKTVEAFEQIWTNFRPSIEGSSKEALRTLVQGFSKQYNVNEDTLLNLIFKRLDEVKGRKSVEEKESSRNLDVEIRLPEYQAILIGTGADDQDLYVKKRDAKEYESDVSQYFKQVSLVHKLKETRVFIGFTRLEPPDNNDVISRKFELAKKPLDWLPAVQVRGEGIFIDFDKEKLEEWASRDRVKKRIEKLESNLKKKKRYHGDNYILNPKFVLLHTFAHLLINQLSYECGYGSSSLRERIYCSQDGSDETMSGILIYTASNDSEGSMGGLVRQGLPQRLENIVYSAIHNAKWCSADPICIQSNGQGPDSCNLAACHNCTLLPETSCEFGNRILDRALIVGTDDDESVGFFSSMELVKQW
ncbi:DUF1998 domain-containing protein [Polycladomyces sp. WAk]|uniref:DUF1998 domain-containing protein n=1 Tax=Polycladomyces zharkentensis TaxID=2807616 RepID=A0ABS2WIZ7_9BACL|nr:DUF1998 domain-containing protein [Polycladomyces sp. WAk]MBN2909535.1 DUF1998 domain-containing protein [Polycladomyces sp. WAk]